MVTGPTVTLRKLVKSGTDGDGNDLFTSSDSTVTADAHWQRASTEQTDGRDTITDDLSLLFTGVPDLTGIDLVVVGGKTFTVDGSPAVYAHPRAGIVKTQVDLKKVTG